MTRQLPPWVAVTAEDPERARYAAMAPEQRMQIFAEVCELGRVLLEGRADRRQLLHSRELMPPDAERVWLQLVRQARRVRPDW